MSKITQYVIVMGYGASELIKNVAAAMTTGWQPLGPAQHIYFPDTTNKHPFEWESYQTMVKYEEEKVTEPTALHFPIG